MRSFAERAADDQRTLQKRKNYENAVALKAVLDGQTGPYRDMVLMNAAAAFWVAGRADSWKDGVALAAKSIDEGHAAQKLNDLAQFSQQA